MNTIKNIISAVVISLLPMWASAQNEGHRVSIIPHAGVTISKMDGSALTASKEWKAGYTFGASVEIPLSQYYSLTTGADFSLIGTGFKDVPSPRFMVRMLFMVILSFAETSKPACTPIWAASPFTSEK